MKIICSGTELLNILGIATTIVSDKSPYPALQYVLLKTRPGEGVVVQATDLEVSLCHLAREVDIVEEGAMLLPAAKTLSLLREIRDERVELTTTEQGVEVVAPGCRFELLSEEVANFPSLPEAIPDDAGSVIEVPLATLQGMIGRTTFAASREETRYALNGVLLKLDGRTLQLAATDGKRLAVTDSTIEVDADSEIHVILPTRGLEVLRRIFSEEAETARLSIDGSNLLVATERVVLSCRLIEGQFPSLKEVLARTYDKRIEVNIGLFQGALRKAALFTTRDSRAVRFSFSFNRLVLSSHVPDVGETEIEMPIDYPFEPLELAFNPQFFLDALSVLGEGVVAVEARSASSSVMLKREGFKYVVMPITLR